MRKIFCLAMAGALVSSSIMAQDTTMAAKKKLWTKAALATRANDHLMVQFGYDNWAGNAESANITGFSRHFNIYGMYDMPFKSNPQMSFAGGIGIGSSSIFFDNTALDIVGKGNTGKADFSDVSNQDHFKKYKLSTTYAEVPLELRWIQDPLHSGKSWKVAVGLKLGLLVDAHTKGKNLVNSSGSSVYGSKYKEKEKSTRYFNSNRMAATIRIGYGAFTLYGAYQLNTVFKENQGIVVRPYSIGICLSGL